MSIEGLPPSSNQFSRMDKVDDIKQKPAAKETEQPAPASPAPAPKPKATPPAATPSAATPNPEASKPAQDNPVQEQQKVIKDKVSHYLAELQTLSEKLKKSQELHQTRSKIDTMGASLREMEKELNQALNERYGDSLSLDNSYSKMSYWDKLDVMTKSQTINRLKDKISATTIDRAHLVNQLKEEIVSGSYAPSSNRILKGMIRELF